MRRTDTAEIRFLITVSGYRMRDQKRDKDIEGLRTTDTSERIECYQRYG